MKKKSLFAIRSYHLNEEQILSLVNDCIGTKEEKAKRIYLKAFEDGYYCGLTDAADCAMERFHEDAKMDEIP